MAPGFGSGIQLRVNETVQVSRQLQPGGVNETVEVNTEAPPPNTANSTVGRIATNQRS